LGFIRRSRCGRVPPTGDIPNLAGHLADLDPNLVGTEAEQVGSLDPARLDIFRAVESTLLEVVAGASFFQHFALEGPAFAHLAPDIVGERPAKVGSSRDDHFPHDVVRVLHARIITYGQVECKQKKFFSFFFFFPFSGIVKV